MKNKKEKREEILDALYTELAEIQAYRQLQDTAFNFGGIDIIPNNTHSEDAYYKAREASILSAIAHYESSTIPQRIRTTKRYKPRHYHTQRKWRKLLNNNILGVYLHNGRIIKVYETRRKADAKHYTNRIVRRSPSDFPLKGGGYRKKFDYFHYIY